jgi:hypothetical protein
MLTLLLSPWPCATSSWLCLQVGVEAFSPAELDYGLLEGKWLLQYTDALDVVSRHVVESVGSVRNSLSTSTLRVFECCVDTNSQSR